MGWIVAVLSLLVAAGSILWLLPTPPSLMQPVKLRGVPLTQAGPVVGGAIKSTLLDGLTVIPLVKLPPIKINIPFPSIPLLSPSSTPRRLRIVVTTTASEVVFNSLSIESASFRAIDAGRQPLSVKVEGANADFRGSFSVKAIVRLEPLGGPSSDGKGPQGRQVFKWAGLGRVDAKLQKSGVDFELQLVKGRAEDSAPRLEVLSSSVDEGVIEQAKLEGFGIWGGILTKILPFVRGTVFVRYPTKVVVDFLARDIVEGPLVDSILATVVTEAAKHLDVDTYGAILDEDREKEIATPLDASSLAPPSSSASPSSPTAANPTASATTSPAPNATPFRLHFHLIGPTVLRDFPLPDFAPQLYRPGGTRAALQQFNMLTSEVQLKITESSLDKITFDRASIAFDPTRPGGGDLVVTVEDLVVVLKSRFSLGADTSSVVSWTTGVKRIGETGSSTTKVEARSLQIRFVLDRRAEGEPGSAFELRESSMSPFTAVEPRFELDRQVMKLGAEVVNAVTAGLKTQIASAASLIVKIGMSAVVRTQLQAAMDGVEEKLSEAGVELPKGLRGGGI